MSEKVILTQEQADAIGELMREPYNNTKDELLVEHTRWGGFINLNKAGVDLPLLAKALYIGYEVETEFNVGDWVITGRGVLGKYQGKSNGVYEFVLVGGHHATSDNLRHATPEEIAKEKERRWWKSHKRDVWELREGDIILPNRAEPKDVTVFVVKEINDNYVFSELESYIHITSVKDSWKVICFAEDRKDV